MEGIETITSVQGTQGSSTGPQPPQTMLQQPETVGSTSSAALAEKFPNQKFNKNSKFTVQMVNGVDKLVFEQPTPKVNDDGSQYVSPNDLLAQKYTWTTVGKGNKNVAIALAATAVPGDTPVQKKNYAYGMIYKVPGLISFSPRSIKGIQYFGVSFDTIEHAQLACEVHISLKINPNST